ncbi:MAG: EAL domain-containing protein [Rhodospirillales bacterium]|jgi:diguanylate cyclase (GGDEF)-like protein/PAS domain S-box-containing protein|nr:EAL domain-containing protein [Rhodospirillales bacterium]
MSSIVVVDDRVTNRNILAQLARSLGADAQVHAFENPQSALDWMMDKKVDLVVTDFQMPGMNGAEFVRECRRKILCFDVPIIVITAYEDRDYRYKALEAGATDFLLSPIDHHEFRTRANNLLTMWRQKQIIQNRAVSLEHELKETILQRAKDLRRSEEKLSDVIDTVPALVSASDALGRYVFLNSFHQTYFDFEPQKAIGRSKSDLFGEEYGNRHRELDQQVFRTSEMLVGVEDQLVDRSGSERIFLTTKAPLRGDSDTDDMVVTVSLDITERMSAEDDVRKLSLAVEQSPASVMITDPTGVIEYVNPKFVDVTGYSAEEVMGKSPQILNSGYTPPEYYRELWETVLAGREWRGEFHNKKKNGENFWEYASVSPIKDHNGEITHLLAVKEDITVRKQHEEQLLQQMNYDNVTDLPNRVLGLDRLTQALARSHRNNTTVALLFIDLDRFKNVNDTLGHSAGDRLLKEAGLRLCECIRGGDTVARLGGDEFTIILPDLQSPNNAEHVAEKVHSAFTQPFFIEGQELFVTASIGITVYPMDADAPHALMQNADAAMYQAKELGKNQTRFFTRELNEQALERVKIENHLRRAIERDEFSLHYQPIAELRSGRLVGAEALLRWHNDELGNVPPSLFIPQAEDAGLISSIGEWVLEDVCRQHAKWRDKSGPPIRISVNVSSRQFREGALVDTIKRASREHGVPWENLELEITEGLLMDDLPESKVTFRELNAMGMRFSLDDFGTGYSSLNYLKRFPVRSLKIDRSFIQGVIDIPDDAVLVQAIINMAHSMKLEVVAEGVETRDQLDFVRQNGCDLVQGYFFSKPIPADQFFELMTDWRGAEMMSA